jgi:uncharacterized repeat protein (TIGR02543 family)
MDRTWIDAMIIPWPQKGRGAGGPCVWEEAMVNPVPPAGLSGQTCAVTFADATGDGSRVVRVAPGSFVRKPSDPTADRDIFDGWYLGDATTAFDFAGTPITGDITLTARWTPAVASVTVGGKKTLYTTLNGASQAAVADGVSEATITILRSYDLPASEGTWEITGHGHDKSKVVVVNDYDVDFTNHVSTSETSGLMSVAINGATVVFKGSGKYTRNAGTHSMFEVGAGTDDKSAITTESAAYAVVEVQGCEYQHRLVTAAAHVWNVQNGKITFNGGTVLNMYNAGSSKYCVRAEKSEVGAGTGVGSVVVNGGSFDLWNSKQPLFCKDGGTVSITGLCETRFYKTSEASITAMSGYLASGLVFEDRDVDGKTWSYVVKES